MHVPDYVNFILQRLEANGHKAYIVGGSVRDALRGKCPDDYDVTTNAAPEKVQAIFSSDCKVILTGIQHGTVTVLSDAHPVEVTTFRTDGSYQDNRHPDSVNFVSTIDADLARRDFTVNAMAYSPVHGLVDLYGGQSDLAAHILRCVGVADVRFHEDALRMLRALRFASVLQFGIEANTAKSIHQNCALLQNVSAERIRTELFKLLCGADAVKILKSYRDVFFTLFPTLESAYSADSYNAAADSIKNLEADPLLRFAALLKPAAKLNKNACLRAITTLKTDRKSADLLAFTMQHDNLEIPANRTDIQKLLYKYDETYLRFYLKLHNRGDALYQLDEIIQHSAPYRISDLQIRGEEIAALGYHGKEIGIQLEMLLMLVIENKIENQHEILLNNIQKRT